MQNKEKYYKELIVEFITTTVGHLSFLPGFENYHEEYLKTYKIEDLEKIVRRIAKINNKHFSFIGGMVSANCMQKWTNKKRNENFDKNIEKSIIRFQKLLKIKNINPKEIMKLGGEGYNKIFEEN